MTLQPPVDWYADLEASSHMTSAASNYSSPPSLSTPSHIFVVNGSMLPVASIGYLSFPNPHCPSLPPQCFSLTSYYEKSCLFVNLTLMIIVPLSFIHLVFLCMFFKPGTRSSGEIVSGHSTHCSHPPRRFPLPSHLLPALPHLFSIMVSDTVVTSLCLGLQALMLFHVIKMIWNPLVMHVS